MKLYPTVFLFLYLLSPIFTYAQKELPTLTWSDKSFWTNQEETKGGFVIIDENRYFLVSLVGKKLSTLKLDLFDKRNLEEVITKKIPLGKKSKRRAFHQISLIGEQVYLFTSLYNKKQKQNTLYLQTISPTDLTTGQLIPISKSFTDGESNTFGINLSPNEQKILIYSIDDFIKKDPVRLKVTVFDNNFQLLWDKKYLLPYENENYKITQNVLDNDGNIYLIGDYAKGKSHKTHQGSLFFLKPDGTTKEQRFGIGKKFIAGLEYHIDHLGTLVATGIFTNITRSGDLFPIIEGIYLFQYNHQTDKLGQRIVYFEANEFTSKLKTVNKKNKFDPRLYLKEVFLKDDNSLLLALEQFEPVNRSGNLALRNTEEWRTLVNNSAALAADDNSALSAEPILKYYKNVVLINIKDFKINWVSTLSKKQRLIAHHKPTASYTSIQQGNDIYFIYNDTKRNYELAQKKLYSYNQLKTHEQAIVVKKLDATGKLETYIPKSTSAHIFPLCTNMSKPLSDSELLLFGDFGEFFRFGNLKL